MDERENELLPADDALESALRTQKAKHTYTWLGFSLFVIAGLTIALQLALGTVAGRLAEQGSAVVQSGWFTWVATFAPMYLIAVPIGLLMMRRLPAAPAEPIRLGGKNFFLFLLMCFPLMYGGNIIGTLLSALLSGGSAQNGLVDLAFDESPLRILVMVVLAPLVEEYIFRKQLIDRAAPFGEKQAILFSGLSFGLFHMNLFQFFYAFGLGLLFAYIYTRTRRLRYTVALHMIINFFGTVLAPYLVSKVGLENIEQLGQMDEAALMQMMSVLAPFLLYAVALIVLSITGLILLLVKLPRLVFLPAAEEMPKNKSFQTVYVNFGVALFVLLSLVMFVIALLI